MTLFSLLSRRARRGAAALEFALCAPVLVTVAAGVVDWGWFLSREAQLEDAARDAARSGAAAPEGVAPEDLAEGRMAESLAALGFDVASSSVTATTVDDATLGGDVLTLQVSTPYNPPVGLIASADFLSATIVMPVAP